MKTVLLTAVVGLVSAGAGFAVPQVIGGRAAESGDESSKSNGSHGGG